MFYEMSVFNFSNFSKNVAQSVHQIASFQLRKCKISLGWEDGHPPPRPSSPANTGSGLLQTGSGKTPTRMNALLKFVRNAESGDVSWSGGELSGLTFNRPGFGPESRTSFEW